MGIKKNKHNIADKAQYFYIKNIKRWMFCPNCKNGKMTFNNKTSLWVCKDCGYNFSEDYFLDDCVFWFCDECETYLNNQEGFDRHALKHICSNCGYENDTTFDNIKGTCSDCGKTLNDSNATLCDDCRRARREKARKWLITAGKVAVGIAAIAGTVILAITAAEEDKLTDYSPSPEDDDNEKSDEANGENKTLYITKEQPVYGKQNYCWNEYRLENDKVVKHSCHRQKIFDGDENEWHENDKVVNSWSTDDPNMPEWLRKYL